MAQAANLKAPVFEKSVKLLIVAVPGSQVAAARTACEGGLVSVEVLDVPDLLSLPTAVAMAVRLTEFDGFIALSGEDAPEADLHEVTRALGLMGLQGVCIGNGTGGRDPAGAAFAALHLVAISRKWAGQTKGIGFRP